VAAVASVVVAERLARAAVALPVPVQLPLHLRAVVEPLPLQPLAELPVAVQRPLLAERPVRARRPVEAAAASAVAELLPSRPSSSAAMARKPN
jgi:hypothetical protein